MFFFFCIGISVFTDVLFSFFSGHLSWILPVHCLLGYSALVYNSKNAWSFFDGSDVSVPWCNCCAK